MRNSSLDKFDVMDMSDKDLMFALQLQDQFNNESENGFPLVTTSNQLKRTSNADHILAFQLQEELSKETEEIYSRPSFSQEDAKTSIVDKFWELNDPNPDLHGLFLEFNASYFWNKLQGVEVRWSSRMTLCAGVCCYEGHGGLCSIRLSLPLLKLRPRKDLVETLLHEMIHAYLFVTHNNRDHDAHGPEFLKHMFRINQHTGANITVYHNFHDEVNEYRQHWWRCNGPCKHRPPYYGIVRRAINRAPSANDFWWEEHRMTCGGTYDKIKEPEKKNTKRKRTEILSGIVKKAKSENMNIKTFIPSPDENQPTNPLSHNRMKEVTNIELLSSVRNNISSNIYSLGSSSSKETKNSQITPFSGKGHILGSSPLQNINSDDNESTLHFYFKSSKNTSGKRSPSSETKFRNEKGSCIHTKKKQPRSSSGSYASPLSNRSLPKEQKRLNMQGFKTTKIDEIWLKAANTKILSQLKEGNSRKKFLPPGKLSTASPLNHLKTICKVEDSDKSNERLYNRTLPKMKTAKSTMQTEQSFNSDSSSLGNPIVLNDASSDSESGDVPTNNVICPVCNQEIQSTDINSHLDLCLSN